MTTAVAAPETDPSAPRRQPQPAPGWMGAGIGLVSAALAVGTALFVAALADVDSPIDAVGSEFIDHTPSWLKTFAIDTFGTNDKVALRVGIYVTITTLALVVGLVARRARVLGAAVFGLFGLFGGMIAAGRPAQTAEAAVPALCAAIAGGTVLWHLAGLLAATDPARAVPGLRRPRRGPDRRRFVVTTGGAALGAIVLSAVARRVEQRRIAQLERSAPEALPPVDADAAAAAPATPGVRPRSVPPGATLSPVTPFITPNDDFYLIDTALSVPRIEVGSWAVRIAGRVRRPMSLTYDDLLARPQVERIITLACVSNEVGGDLIGNAVWQGVLLGELLNEAGVQPEAEQVFGTSIDGWTCGFPVELALDGRDAMIAIGMNGEPLPVKHGFPARLVVPGLYGYVSATKWLSGVQLTTWDEAEGYWVPRGWSRDGPIKTQSRIDVPRRNERLSAGPVTVAGVAWAQHRGIAKVEVRVDRGEWHDARLGTDVSDDSWRQWAHRWEATPGTHTIQVRATDNDGVTQVETVSRPDPDGATGWHTRTVEVG